MKKLDTEEFKRRARETHGETYDYSNSEYVSYRTSITIICPVHGEFQQLPSNHLKGSGCLKCSEERKKMTTETFIERASNVHNNFYDYSQTALSGMNNKVTIICPIHGEFEQRAASHLDGNGCSKCAGVDRSNTGEFIEKAKRIHGDKFSYGNVDYVNSHTKVTITCPVHGNFEQTPSDHLHGYGCPKCAPNYKVSRDVFIEKARKVHSDKYSYDKLVVKGMNTKGIISCPEHGEFEQRLADHVNGAGCPECGAFKQGGYNEEFFENSPEHKIHPAKIYVIEIDNEYCKLGITAKKYVKDRFSGVRFKVAVEKNMSLYDAFVLEQTILAKYEKYRYRVTELKKRKKSGWTECFPIELLPELVKEVAE